VCGVDVEKFNVKTTTTRKHTYFEGITLQDACERDQDKPTVQNWMV